MAAAPVRSDEDVRRSPGRPRAAAVDARIMRCALDEIADAGLTGFSLVSVARRAGVAKNTVYLRWPRREDLMRAALATGEDGHRLPLPTGELEVDLASMIDHFASAFGSETGLATYYQASTSSRVDQEMWAWYKANIIDTAHAVPEQLIRFHQDRGTARADADASVIARMLAGGVYTEAILETPHGSVSDHFRQTLLTYLMTLLAPTD
jgi:AcrR family transcriptional regulator